MRVILLEDSGLLRDGLRRTLAARGVDVVADSPEATDAVRLVAEHRPDVMVADLRMPPSHTDEGLRAIVDVVRTHPGTGCLLLSQYADSAIAARLLEVSESHVGYLLKDRITDPDQLCEALNRLAAGEVVIDAALVQQMLRRRVPSAPVETLTSRERQVLALMAEGRSNAGVGERLYLSPKTVERHIAQIFEKLGLTAESESNRRVLAVLSHLRAAGQAAAD